MGLICVFTLTSQSDDRQYRLVGGEASALGASRVIDDRGNTYPATAVRLGDHTGNGNVINLLTAGVPMIARLAFGNAKPDVTTLASVEIVLAVEVYNAKSLRFQFRNVSVKR